MSEHTSPHEHMDVKKMRRRVLLYYTRDGLWDICIGICVVGWALALRFDFIAFVGVVFAAAVALVPPVKQKLTHPRIGYARFRPDPGTRKLLAVLVGAGAGVLVLVVVAGAGMRELLSEYLEVWLGGMAALLLIVLAHVFAARRFYLHGLLVFLAGVVTWWAVVDLWLAVVVAGAIIIGIGAYVLYRFLGENPVQQEDMSV